jgi:hypothetical protein
MGAFFIAIKRRCRSGQPGLTVNQLCYALRGFKSLPPPQFFMSVDKEEFNKFILNEPLFVGDFSVQDFDVSELQQNGGSVFVGLGLVSSGQLTTEVPFDVLGLLLPAEKLRARFNLDAAVVQIADVHALALNEFDPLEVMRVADLVEDTVRRALANLGLNTFKLFKASERDKSILSPTIKDKIRADPRVTNDYILNEVLDIELLRKSFDMRIKLSWIIPGVENCGHDERLYDDIYTDVVRERVAFLHMQPGFSFDDTRWRLSPYIHLGGDARILLTENENVSEKFSKYAGCSREKTVHNHLRRTVRAYESLFGNLTGLNLQDKVQYIIDRCTSDGSK